MNKSVPLCIYHANCADGFTAAFVVNKKFDGNVEFFPGVYQNPPPDVTGRDVILVDFSYKRPVMEQICEDAKSVLILDHHKSAIEDLRDLTETGWENTTAVFDVFRSGARIAWDYFFPSDPAPKLVRYVQDRDLWKFELPGSREVAANIFSYEYTFENWHAIEDCLEFSPTLFRNEGAAIERKHFKDIKELLGVMTQYIILGPGLVVPCANLPYIFSSDACHMLASEDDGKIGACYWRTKEGWVFSLRSTEDGPDVSEIAKLYGGGGHKHAAGFKISLPLYTYTDKQEAESDKLAKD